MEILKFPNIVRWKRFLLWPAGIGFVDNGISSVRITEDKHCFAWFLSGRLTLKHHVPLAILRFTQFSEDNLLRSGFTFQRNGSSPKLLPFHCSKLEKKTFVKILLTEAK